MPGRRPPPEIEAIFEQARRAAGDSPPRKHHLVPASYLRRWAEAGRLRVTDVDTKKAHVTSPEKAARETDFYSLRHDDVDPDEVPPLLMETVLGRLEAQAKVTVDRLLDCGSSARFSTEERFHFSLHLAFQLTRGRAFRAEHDRMLNDSYRLMYEGISDQAIERRLEQGGVEPTPEVVAQHRQWHADLQSGAFEFRRPVPALVALAAQAASDVGEHIFTRRWVVVETKPVLLTTDEPVVPIAGPGAPRAERGGTANAGVIIFPLDPSHLLAMFHAECARKGSTPWTRSTPPTSTWNYLLPAPGGPSSHRIGR